MTELLFTLKTFLAATLLVTLMQIKVSGVTLERRAELWLETSTVAHFVQGAAVGAVHASMDLYRTISEFWGSPGSSDRTQRASR